MKKLLIVLVATIALASCSNKKTTEELIYFGSFTENLNTSTPSEAKRKALIPLTKAQFDALNAGNWEERLPAIQNHGPDGTSPNPRPDTRGYRTMRANMTNLVLTNNDTVQGIQRGNFMIRLTEYSRFLADTHQPWVEVDLSYNTSSPENPSFPTALTAIIEGLDTADTMDFTTYSDMYLFSGTEEAFATWFGDNWLLN
jgi:hypothetical protein